MALRSVLSFSPHSAVASLNAKAVKGCFHFHTVFPKLIAGKVELVVPNDTVAPHIYIDRIKQLRIFLQLCKKRHFFKKRIHIIELRYALAKLHAQAKVLQCRNAFHLMKHTSRLLIPTAVIS